MNLRTDLRPLPGYRFIFATSDPDLFVIRITAKILFVPVAATEFELRIGDVEAVNRLWYVLPVNIPVKSVELGHHELALAELDRWARDYAGYMSCMLGGEGPPYRIPSTWRRAPEKKKPKSPADDALNRLLPLVLRFRQEVVPPLNDRLAECVAIYWVILKAYELLGNHSGALLGERIAEMLTSASWSAWHGDLSGFQHQYNELRQVTIAAKQVTLTMGAGAASKHDRWVLALMIIAKSALAAAGLDDTDSAIVQSLMSKFESLHLEVAPIVRTVH